MLPRIRRVSSILRHNREDPANKDSQPAERLSNKSNDSSGKSSSDGNSVYVETLLYIVHVDEVSEEMYDAGDEQQPSTANPLVRRMSKRTTASFNGRRRTSDEPIYSRPSFTFVNSLRRLNSLLKPSEQNEFPLRSATENHNNSSTNDEESAFPPPPPSFLCDDADQRLPIEATGPGLENGLVAEQCHFDLNAPNAELQKLVIAIDGPSKADIQIDVIDTDVYRVYYTCQTAGRYLISLTYDGEHIGRSPYHLHLRDLPRATIEPLEFPVNTPCIVVVRPAVPCAIFQAYIRAPQGNLNLPITVHKSAKTSCYEIHFIPHTSGVHWLNVSLNHVPVVDNPCRLTVRPSPATKPVAAAGQGLFHAYTGEPSQFFVSKSPNNPSSIEGAFSVGISGPSTVFLDANETPHGYEFNYKPTRTGRYIITIKNGGKHIQGSPFICRVFNKLNESHTLLSTMYETDNDLATETTAGSTTRATSSCQSLLPALNRAHASTNRVDLDILRSSMTGIASKVGVFGTSLFEAKPRRKASFKVDASQAGPGLLLVGLYSSSGSSERLVIKRDMSTPARHVYKVSYRVRARGQYMLVILYGSEMQHVPGSPYLVHVE